MTLDTIFSLVMALAVVGWLALLAAPLAYRWTIGGARVVVAALAFAYVVQLFTITQPVANASFTTLGGVAALFSLPGNVMVGWTHYLAFDLFAGSWEAEDANRVGIAHWAIIVPLFLTFMLGPVGFLTYMVIRTVHIWRRHGRLLG